MFGLTGRLDAKGETIKWTNGFTWKLGVVTICHKPGTPAKAELRVSADKVQSFLGQGDYLGSCVWEYMMNECNETVAAGASGMTYLQGWKDDFDKAGTKCMNDANCLVFCHHPQHWTTYHNISVMDSQGFQGSEVPTGCNRCFLKRFQASAELLPSPSTLVVGPLPTKSCAPSCQPAEHEEMQGADVKHLQISGETESEKDTACCLACQQNRDCEFWVRDLDTTCWLKKDFRGYSATPDRRGSFVCEPGKTETSSPVHKDCVLRDHTQEAEHSDMTGASVKSLQLFGYNQTEAQMDGQCAYACSTDPDCEFWVRDLVNTCFLKKDFREFAESTQHRGDFVCEPGTVRNPPAAPAVPAAGECSVPCGGGVQKVVRNVTVAPRGTQAKQCPALEGTVACNQQSCACHAMKDDTQFGCKSKRSGMVKMWSGFQGHTMGAGEYVLARTKDGSKAVHVCQQRHPKDVRITRVMGYRARMPPGSISFNQQKTINADYSGVQPSATGTYVFGGVIGNDPWELVRRVKPGTTWHPSTDDLAGTDQYGTYDPSLTANATFSVPFQCSFFLFATGDMKNWLIASKSSVSGTYSNEPRSIVRSSTNINTYDAVWNSRSSYTDDPWISLNDYQSAKLSGNTLYGEAGYTSVVPNGPNVLEAHNGANVFCLAGGGQCTSTPGWNNGYGAHQATGLNCSEYVAQGFCTGTSVVATDYTGAANNYPEHNCCECGRTDAPPSHSLVSGSYWGKKTRHKGNYTKRTGEYCLTDTTTTSPKYQKPIGTACCDSVGKGTRTGCHSGTYGEAVAHCESQGLTLCSISQLKAGSGEASGCGFDGRLQWSKSPCSVALPATPPAVAAGSYHQFPRNKGIEEVTVETKHGNLTHLSFVESGWEVGSPTGKFLWITLPGKQNCEKLEGLCGALNPAADYSDAYTSRSGVAGLYPDTYYGGPVGGAYQTEFAESWKVMPGSADAMFTEAECPSGDPNLVLTPPPPFWNCSNLRDEAELGCGTKWANVTKDCIKAIGITLRMVTMTKRLMFMCLLSTTLAPHPIQLLTTMNSAQHRNHKVAFHFLIVTPNSRSIS